MVSDLCTFLVNFTFSLNYSKFGQYLILNRDFPNSEVLHQNSLVTQFIIQLHIAWKENCHQLVVKTTDFSHYGQFFKIPPKTNKAIWIKFVTVVIWFTKIWNVLRKQIKNRSETYGPPCRLIRAAMIGKTDKTEVFPGFCGIQCRDSSRSTPVICPLIWRSSLRTIWVPYSIQNKYCTCCFKLWHK